MNDSTYLFGQRWQVQGRRRLHRRLTPAQLFVGSFALMVLLGAVGLRTIPGLYTGRPMNWLDALFTATSAVCVTGLTVADTATVFTRAGQAYLLLLIQLGGLGMITFTSLIIVALGRRLSLRQEVLTGVGAVVPHINAPRLVRDVVLFTAAIEVAGALLLYALWAPRLGWADAAWHAVFHSVSAFCNAGFSTFSDSLIGFDDAPFSLAVVMLLIVLGGIGFLTLEELYLRWQAGRQDRVFRISLHSRIVIVTTAVLLLAGWAAFAVLEWNDSLSGPSVPHRLVNALFLSVTARTAGFNTIDYAAATDAGNVVTALLMFVGGSPGSTAGGVKTTTAAMVVLIAWSRIRGRETISVASRSIPPETLQRAIGLLVVSFAVVTAAILVLTITESTTARPRGFLSAVFEVVSAFNTVGLSMGFTAELSPPGRVLVMLLMFVGRVGPLAFAAMLTRPLSRAMREFRYAYEDVVVG